MAPRLLRSVVALAPPWWRRAMIGAVADLKSLPARLRDPARRAEPWAVLHNVGDGDFLAVGVQLARHLTEHAGLKPTDRVLDIGCGTGRVAEPLSRVLADGGAYLGFDISRTGIAACRRRFAARPQMRFAHLDVWNGEYNRFGQLTETNVVFPTPDAAVDLAFATSVFTHMRMAGLRRYLSEVARVLAPGGRFAFTAFALSPGREVSAAFPFRPFDATSKVVDLKYPERAIGHRREAIEDAIAEAGLTLALSLNGVWAEPAGYDGGQDLFVVVKP